MIENPNDRLNCYDGIFRPVDLAPSSGNWDISTRTSALDDSKVVVIRVDSENNVRNRFGSVGPATFLARCSENTTSAFFTFAGEFMADIQSYGRIDYRVDDRPARNRNFTASTSNEALGLWRGSGSIPFLKEISDGSSLLIRVTPFNESPIELTFVIAGMEEALVPLREACNW